MGFTLFAVFLSVLWKESGDELRFGVFGFGCFEMLVPMCMVMEKSEQLFGAKQE